MGFFTARIERLVFPTPYSTRAACECPKPRASNEGLHRPRVARAQGTVRLPFFPFFPPLFLCGIVLEGVGRWSSTARIEGPQFYRGASASNEDHLSISSSSLLLLFSPMPRGDRGLGRAPMLVQLRPSNEALPRARVPGARGNMGVLPLSALASPSSTPVQYDFPVTHWLSDSFSSFRDSAQVRRRNQISHEN